jgi:arginyl-tRNA synthetase
MNEKLITFLQDHITIELDFGTLLEKPKHESHGDFSLPCFLIAKEWKKSPVQVSQELGQSLSEKLPGFLSKVVSVGPFLNFYLNSEQEVQDIFENFENLLTYKTDLPQKILIEYPSPNTNKSLHIGHTRNMLLGSALSNTLRVVGHDIVRTNLNNDRGISICYAMLMYKEFYSTETPKSLGMKPDEFVAHCYVEFKKKCVEFPERKFEEQAQQMLVEWEANNKEVRDLWKKLLDFVYMGYHKTYENYHLGEFDKQYFESHIYDQGKEIVLSALDKNVKGFKQEDDGAVYIDLEEEGYGKKYLLRGDQTTLYMTQDIYLASIKETDFHADKYVFVVGQEQEYHFKVLFELLDRLKIVDTTKNYHFAYGYVYNEKGEKFSSRLGNTIGADFVYDEMVAKAKENLLGKELTKDLSEDELNRRAGIIGFGALAFTFLKQNPIASMNFSMESALSFEGETGPYCQYTYARIQSLKRRVNFESDSIIDYSLFNEQEITLVKLLKEYLGVLKEASEKYKISSLAHFAIKLAQGFNDFYQNSSIIKADSKELQQARLHLAHNVGIMLKETLSVLGIDVLDEM